MIQAFTSPSPCYYHFFYSSESSHPEFVDSRLSPDLWPWTHAAGLLPLTLKTNKTIARGTTSPRVRCKSRRCDEKYPTNVFICILYLLICPVLFAHFAVSLLAKHQQRKKTTNSIYSSIFFPPLNIFLIIPIWCKPPACKMRNSIFKCKLALIRRQLNMSSFAWMHPRGNLCTTSNTPKHLCATVGLASGSTVKFLPLWLI